MLVAQFLLHGNQAFYILPAAWLLQQVLEVQGHLEKFEAVNQRLSENSLHISKMSCVLL